jgi:hypothetical protein
MKVQEERKRKIYNITSPLPRKRTLKIICLVLLFVADIYVAVKSYHYDWSKDSFEKATIYSVYPISKKCIISYECGYYDIYSANEFAEFSKLKENDVYIMQCPNGHMTFLKFLFMIYCLMNGIIIASILMILLNYVVETLILLWSNFPD